MGSTCIIGVDKNRILQDFIRAHAELLTGDKVCLDRGYPDLAHDGWTVRHFYSTNPISQKLKKLLPQAIYDPTFARQQTSFASIHDAFAAFFHEHKVDVILAEFGPAGADIAPHAKALGIPLVVHFHGHDAHRTSVVNEYRDRYREMFRWLKVYPERQQWS